MQLQSERWPSCRVPPWPPRRKRREDPELTLALQHFDDDGSPLPSSTDGDCPFTVRDLQGEPRRDEHELGGEG